jgi:hypothetical protein
MTFAHLTPLLPTSEPRARSFLLQREVSVNCDFASEVTSGEGGSWTPIRVLVTCSAETGPLVV